MQLKQSTVIRPIPPETHSFVPFVGITADGFENTVENSELISRVFL